ncbi:hypothetical protein HIM_00470 [Hirsutella minnesotensis 3608]|nr:hypothetical protein HIM_00470 [Hirsutella minnesotensis 3608]
MDEKALLSRHLNRHQHQYHLQRQPAMPVRSRPVVRSLLLFAFVVVIGFYGVTRPFAWNPSFAPLAPASRPAAAVHVDKRQKLVPLEAHIISKCPDTRDALRKLILPTMQRVYDKVDFKLNYIGKPTANDGIDCKHGPSECMGNIIELCARELYPEPKTNLGFIMCLTKDYGQIPDRALVEDCALEHAIDFRALNECATRDDGAHGMQLLRTSVQRTSDVSRRPRSRQ